MKNNSPWGSIQFNTPVLAGAKPANSGSTLKDKMAEAYQIQAEQAAANEYLTKAMDPMVELLKMRLANRTPLIVMRPIQYETSMLKSQVSARNSLKKGLDSKIEDSFYNGGNNQETQQNDSYIDTVDTIYPGTQLLFKGLNPGLKEFVFEDAVGNQYNISYSYRNQLLTQTDIFEKVREYFDKIGG